MKNKSKNIISSVIKNGYYSNHGPLAQELEKYLETKFKMNCVTYASIELLIVAIWDELSISQFTFYNSVDQRFVYQLIKFLRGLETAQIFTNCSQIVSKKMVNDIKTKHLKILCEAQTTEGKLVKVVDLSRPADHYWVNGAAAVSFDDVALEKLRWSRSSYGRQADAIINIAANGRFSELQASAILDD